MIIEWRARRIGFFTLLLGALAGCASAPPQPAPKPVVQTLTRNDALKRPIPELAAQVLGPFAPSAFEMMRPTFVGIPGGSTSLSSLVFATKPESAGYAGLCAAQLLMVSFVKADPEEKSGDSNTPVRPNGIQTSQVFKIIGDTAFRRMKDWTDAASAALDRKCQATKGVVSSKAGAIEEDRFFTVRSSGRFSPANAAWISATLLQQAIGHARSAAGPQPTCSSERSTMPCRDPRDITAGLDLNTLIGVSVSQCAGSARTCIRGEFRASTDFTSYKSWVLMVEAEVGESGDSSPDVGPVESVQLSSSGLLFG